MNNGIEAIIFDYDGTLRHIDMRKIYEAHLEIFKSFGIFPEKYYGSFEEYMQWKGMAEDFYEKERREEAQKIFHSYYDKFVPLFPWVEDVIKKLSKKYTLTILSNSAKYYIENQLGRLTGYFKIIIGNTCVNNMKPNIEGLALIMNKVKILEPEKILLIGDTITDITTARNGGIKIGIVNWGSGDFDKLSLYNPDYKFETPEELILKLV